ncbi:MAG: hypothetical protein IJ294_01255 [Clostridia bacterium]|nr:hypothetical protein [Clostridia bacterium]
MLIEVHCIISIFAYCALCRKRGKKKGMGAEDGLWQKVDLAAGNKIPDVVAAAESYLLLYFGGDPCQTFCLVRDRCRVFSNGHLFF